MTNKLIKNLGFIPKENTTNIYHKKYSSHNNYVLEIDFDKNSINYGKQIFFNDTKNSIQNINKPEDLVVLECVDRLLEKGYNPNNIILEKVYPSGHGTSGRLDILIVKDDGSAYMMIECKTWSKEFDKAFNKLQKDGGQLFTYFQQDKNAEILVLYTSTCNKEGIQYTNQIVKIEEEYRATSNVKDFYDRWNKIPKNNGVFESYTNPYEFISKALTKNDLKVLKHEDSSNIFNRFLEILRHNVVSDKPNAFNKIFTLFLCKIVDEDRLEDEQLHFQWLDGEDNHISFQKRLSDLYNRGMKELLEKNVTDISDNEFDKQFQQVEDEYKTKFKELLTEIRLKKNNEFAIKEVFDDDSFKENAIVVKEIVELLQTYQIRYNYRQQFLSDFFEQLLTTGLKQESGQFFTPVPVARFILKSMPINTIIEEKLKKGDKNDLLPTIIDYSAGSGHFITESMEEVQKHINTIDESSLKSTTKKTIAYWKNSKYDWAEDYVYAIEKDYRLIKTAKVSCYLHGDGLAKVIHGDGLADFTTAKEYKDRLTIVDKTYPQDNKQFDIIVSNPPYSVSAFKNMMDSEKSKKNFELYDRLTEQSSEIETLFIERTKQLLKDGGIAGIILPSSILSNSGIYTKTREIIFNYFDIISIVELGSNTFMETGTNTVVLFLRRKNNADHINVKASVDKLYEQKKDITINGIKNPLEKYINHVWEDIELGDYLTLLENNPNDKIKNHELYKEYDKKLDSFDKITTLEKEKLLYFISAYKQKITVIKTGEKKEEKRFLGYEFSRRRGNEGIHPTQKGKTIDECTKLYDEFSYANSLKANSYIYSAFRSEFREIDESLKENVSYVDLVDMMTYDRVDFEKSITLSVKKKFKIESKWEQVSIYNSTSKIQGNTTKISKDKILDVGKYPVITQEVDEFISGYTDNVNVINDLPVIMFGDHNCSFKYIDFEFIRGADGTVMLKPDKRFIPKYYYFILNNSITNIIENRNKYERHNKYLQALKIPLPPKDIQEKIVDEVEKLENLEEKYSLKKDELKKEIEKIVDNISAKEIKLHEITTKIGSGATPRGGESSYKLDGISLIRSQNIHDNKFVKKGLVFIDKEQARKLNNVEVKKDDILFNITGASIARCCIVDSKYLPARVNQHVSIIRTNEKADPKYIQMILISNKYKNKLLEIGSGGTSREAITKSQLEEFKIPFLSLEEQKNIVLKIEAIEKKISEKEEELKQIPQQKEDILKGYLN